MTKVLISIGFGAGWSSWNSSHGRELATDPELVRLVDAGEHRGDGVSRSASDPDYALCHASPVFVKRAQEIVGNDDGEPRYVCFLGVDGLVVEEASGPFRVHEYDGAESLEVASEMDWW